MTTKEKQMSIDYKEFIEQLNKIKCSADEEGLIATSSVDAVIVDYTMRLNALSEKEKSSNG